MCSGPTYEGTYICNIISAEPCSAFWMGLRRHCLSQAGRVILVGCEVVVTPFGGIGLSFSWSREDYVYRTLRGSESSRGKKKRKTGDAYTSWIVRGLCDQRKHDLRRRLKRRGMNLHPPFFCLGRERMRSGMADGNSAFRDMGKETCGVISGG